MIFTTLRKFYFNIHFWELRFICYLSSSSYKTYQFVEKFFFLTMNYQALWGKKLFPLCKRIITFNKQEFWTMLFFQFTKKVFWSVHENFYLFTFWHWSLKHTVYKILVFELVANSAPKIIVGLFIIFLITQFLFRVPQTE